MAELRQSVLIGDENRERAEWLSQFLIDNYNTPARIGDTFDLVGRMAREAPGSIVFLADTLPYSYDFPVAGASNFIQLLGIDPSVRMVCVVTGKEAPPIQGVRAQICYIRLPSDSPTRVERSHIAASLEPLGDRLPRSKTTVEEVARLTRWRQDDRVLREQILSLSNRQDLKNGLHHLHSILRNCLDFENVKGVRIEPLSQGKSGALVFRLSVRSKVKEKGRIKENARDYVLKLSPTEDVWKLKSEVSGYLKARKSDLYSTYQAHIPALMAPQIPRSASERGAEGEEFNYITSSLPWDAIYYDFLGGELGECMALDIALISKLEKIREKTQGIVNQKLSLPLRSGPHLRSFRIGFLDSLLSALSSTWYLNGASNKRRNEIMWKRANAPDRQYDPLPPYRFTKRTKYWLQEFLYSQEAEIGQRLFSNWNGCRDRLLILIDDSKSAKPLGKLGETIPVTLSPVHGDLNSGNAFLWLKRDSFPFLIDLPFYQSEGHVVQDFARLEVEVKFALMDRQRESSQKELPAFDHGPNQVRLWKELEDHLLADRTFRPGEPKWRSPGFRDNVSESYQLIKSIRSRAQIAQQQTCRHGIKRPVPFMKEYLPSLLYHTTRAATFPTLSIFKRLFAVYSAGSILRRMGLW